MTWFSSSQGGWDIRHLRHLQPGLHWSRHTWGPWSSFSCRHYHCPASQKKWNIKITDFPSYCQPRKDSISITTGIKIEDTIFHNILFYWCQIWFVCTLRGSLFNYMVDLFSFWMFKQEKVIGLGIISTLRSSLESGNASKFVGPRPRQSQKIKISFHWNRCF